MYASIFSPKPFEKLCSIFSLTLCITALIMTITLESLNSNVTWAIFFSNFIISALPGTIHKNKSAFILMTFGILTTLYFTISSFV